MGWHSTNYIIWSVIRYIHFHMENKHYLWWSQYNSRSHVNATICNLTNNNTVINKIHITKQNAVVSICLKPIMLIKFTGPDHGPSGPWGMKVTVGPSYIYLQYWPYFIVLFLLLPSLLRNVVYVKKTTIFCMHNLLQNNASWNILCMERGLLHLNINTVYSKVQNPTFWHLLDL